MQAHQLDLNGTFWLYLAIIFYVQWTLTNPTLGPKTIQITEMFGSLAYYCMCMFNSQVLILYGIQTINFKSNVVPGVESSESNPFGLSECPD